MAHQKLVLSVLLRREEHEKLQREREIELEKREKAAFKAQRDRLRQEIANDKAERAAEAARRRGETPDQVKKAFQEAYDRALGKEKDQEKAAQKAALSAEEKMDAAIKDLAAYRAGGDGERALSTIKKMLSNIVSTPEEPKFKQINLQNAAFKKRVASLMGGVALFKACGFNKDTVQQKLILEDDALNVSLLETAVSKIDAALAKA
ncbi:UBX domain-containing protein 6 [Hondaea fermentalgiana]|uniref:UBX domain-containing protein 6 n=1 Tax=Hondaea fermentalgiana TaxID=2315210 RepID=A0A2R5G896_9STRA|nr:UBX domain-containing protein 6 [Hondaea fermentalgiana]|eukprot:GBG26539.1 UBX domain-containing protein 6 [Hondaea fermentalgiana]